MSIYKNKTYNRRKEAGLCVKCGKPLDREGIYCKSCCENNNENSRLTWAYYIKHGVCPRCRNNSIFGDETRCLECTAKGYENTMRTRNRERHNENQRKSRKKAYEARKESGICTRCGKRKVDYGKLTCGICRAKGNERRRIKYYQLSDRGEKGLCSFCDNPVKEGYKVCENHYQMNLQKLNHPKCIEAREKIKMIESRRIESLRLKRDRNE